MNLNDAKYISLLAPSLRNFKRKGNNVYNFSCPLCGDSQKNKHRARGYLFEVKNNLVYKCHNCGVPLSFPKLLKTVNHNLYNEYVIDCLRDEGKYFKDTPSPTVERTKYDIGVFKVLKTIEELPLEHFAKAFVVKRKIPKKYHSLLYFTPDYQEFVNNLIPDKLKRQNTPRLVIPFFGYDHVIGFQGRALDNNYARYISIVLDDSFPPIYGIRDVDFNKKFYVFEGPIDSMFIDNSIATNNGDLVSCLTKIGCNRENAVLVWDNEPRNSEIVKKIKKAIEYNYSVVIWPSDLFQKDVNDMILSGYTSSEIHHIIDKNTFSGLEAELNFTRWSRT